MRSTHDKRNKTQKVFRGWDFGEIIEWMEVDYKDSHIKMFKYRLKEFYKTMKIAFKELFKNRFYNEEEREIEEAKKALNHLLYLKDSDPRFIHKVAGLRTYVKKLYGFENTYLHPLWKGLYEIESDSEFIRYVSLLLEYMWD